MGGIIMTNQKYLTYGRYSGQTILKYMNEKNQIYIIDTETNKKFRIQINTKISPYGVYTITSKGTHPVITKDPTSWSCSKDEYNNLMNAGNELVDRLFGDLIKDVKNTRR